MRSSEEKDISPGIKAQKQKEIIRKIRDSLKKAVAKNKSCLLRKTSISRRLQKSSLMKSQPSFEASLYERTLLFNNRKLAHALQNLRHENRLLQDQIVELNHQTLDLGVQQAEKNCQLFQQQQKNIHKDKLIEKLGCKFMEIAEMLSSGYYDLANEKQHGPIDDGASNKTETSNVKNPSQVSVDALQASMISNNEDDTSSVENSHRPPRLSYPFDLSVIMEVPDKSLNDSVGPSYPDSIKAPGIPAVLLEIDPGKFRRETFVVHESKQLSDLPSPLKTLRSRIRLRRSDSFEPMRSLSETPENPTEANDLQSTISFPVDMELTSVLHTPITGFATGCDVLQHAAGSSITDAHIDDSKVISSSINYALTKEPDTGIQIKNNAITELFTATLDENTTCLGDNSNYCITSFENATHMDGGNRKFSFVTERLSNKGRKRSTASARTSMESAGAFMSNRSSIESEVHHQISSNASDTVSSPARVSQERDIPIIIPEQVISTPCVSSSYESAASKANINALQQMTNNFLKKQDEMEAIDAGDQLKRKIIGDKCGVMVALDIPAKELEAKSNSLLTVKIVEKNELSCKKKRVSFDSKQLPPLTHHPKKVKSRRKRSAASKSSAFKNEKNELPVEQSPAKDTENPPYLVRTGDMSIDLENRLVPDKSTLTRKPKKLPLKKQKSSSCGVVILENATQSPEKIPDRCALGDVSPNRLELKPKDNFSPSHGKPFLKTCQDISERATQDLQKDNTIIERRCRTRAPVVYKERSVMTKMRRE